MSLAVPIDAAYPGRAAHWEKSASIRSRPRRILKASVASEQFYPRSRQPICLHPVVRALDESAVQFILVQSLYKFLSDIAFLETAVVCDVMVRLTTAPDGRRLPLALHKDLLSVLVDEGYHAYVAVDFMHQIHEITGIAALPLPDTIQIAVAIKQSLALLDPVYHSDFEVVAVCIAENSLTKELLNINRETGLNPTFHEINNDHMIDEVRHSLIFTDLLRLVWSAWDEPRRIAIGQRLPAFIADYLRDDLQKSFDRSILEALQLPKEAIETVIADSHLDLPLRKYRTINPIVDRVVEILDGCGVLRTAGIAEAFAAAGLVDTADTKVV